MAKAGDFVLLLILVVYVGNGKSYAGGVRGEITGGSPIDTMWVWFLIESAQMCAIGCSEDYRKPIPSPNPCIMYKFYEKGRIHMYVGEAAFFLSFLFILLMREQCYMLTWRQTEARRDKAAVVN
ncbi:hypothetical protein ACLOJK_018403 [Asimina triloba]